MVVKFPIFFSPMLDLLPLVKNNKNVTSWMPTGISSN